MVKRKVILQDMQENTWSTKQDLSWTETGAQIVHEDISVFYNLKHFFNWAVFFRSIRIQTLTKDN